MSLNVVDKVVKGFYKTVVACLDTADNLGLLEVGVLEIVGFLCKGTEDSAVRRFTYRSRSLVSLASIRP